MLMCALCEQAMLGPFQHHQGHQNYQVRKPLKQSPRRTSLSAQPLTSQMLLLPRTQM